MVVTVFISRCDPQVPSLKEADGETFRFVGRAARPWRKKPSSRVLAAWIQRLHVPPGSIEMYIPSSSKGLPRPSIVTPPKDIWNVTGAQIYLSCEVMGIPTPVLIWNKIIRGQYGVQRMELLPGDRENLAIQTRGGPEKHEVTGWVLISPLSKEDAGEYECHASNAKGEATASAKIHVVETLHEIALTKDDGAEL
nr:PREDICTED: insulin-like growth factor-binding protein 7 [Opisthocomus hoazin]